MANTLKDKKKPTWEKVFKDTRARAGREVRGQVPKQKRSKKTRSHISKVARDLFAQRGYYAVNSNQIAAEAGVSVGTFYTYFKDKKDILLEILYNFYDHFWMDVMRDVMREVQNEPPEKLDLKLVLRTIVEKSLESFDQDPDFTRLIHSMRYYDEDIRKIFEEVEKREIRYVVFTMEISQGFYSQSVFNLKNKEPAALVTMKLIETLGLTDFPIDREVLIDEVTRMIYLYYTQP